MKKTLLLFAVMAMVGSSVFGQLSTRTNNDGEFALGTRPQAGDAALHFAIPLVNLSADDGSGAGLYKANALASGDLLTFKYYKTDDFVIRAAIRLASDNSVTNGEAVDSTDANPIIEDAEFSNIKMRSVMREYNLAIGCEKHFTNKNIFDVYVGGEARIGLGKDQSIMELDYFNGDLDYTTMTTNTTIFGAAGVVGFNVFIAELPVAIGLEYGLSGKFIFGGKTKVERQLDIDAADVNFTEEWFQQDVDAFGDPDFNSLGDPRQYSSLNRRQFNMDTNHSVRVNILIYFSTSRGGAES